MKTFDEHEMTVVLFTKDDSFAVITGSIETDLVPYESNSNSDE